MISDAITALRRNVQTFSLSAVLWLVQAYLMPPKCRVKDLSIFFLLILPHTINVALFLAIIF